MNTKFLLVVTLIGLTLPSMLCAMEDSKPTHPDHPTHPFPPIHPTHPFPPINPTYPND